MIEKLTKILALAENASTPEEAAAFMEKANMLSAKYSIELAKARAAIAHNQTRETPTQRRTKVAEASTKTKKWMVRLYQAIAENNDVEINVTYNSTTVIAFGFPSDIDVADAMFFSLSRQMVEQANTWLATKEYKKEQRQVWSEKDWEYIYKPVDARIARADFYRMFISAVDERMKKTTKQVMEQESTGTELVLLDKREEVSAYYKEKSTAHGSWGGPSVSGMSQSARTSGYSAGKSAKLSGTQGIGGTRKAIG